MIINRLLRLIPEKFKDYQYVSKIIPGKYRGDIDRVVKQFRPEWFEDREMGSDSASADEVAALNNDEVEKKRANLVKNLSNDQDGQFPKGYTDMAHEQSLKDHEAQSSFSASPVNGAGNVGGKVNSNMSHRNYQ